jgi:D-alanine-D-alanine ligase
VNVVLLVHSDLIPPEDAKPGQFNREEVPWVTEFDVKQALLANRHTVEVLGVYEELKSIQAEIHQFRPKVVFNLLEEFRGEAIFDQNVVSHLELLGVPYTGSNPKGLIISRDKALCKKILTYHKIPTPKFQVFPRNNTKMQLRLKEFPLIVKCLNEEASLGISQASVVHSLEKLRERVEFIHEKFKTDAIVEEFIEGSEYFVGVIGNYRLQTFPAWELRFDKVKNPEKQLYSTNAKFDEEYRSRNGITTQRAEISEELERYLQKLARRAYRALGISGYARLDLRVDRNGKAYVIEVNPNPDISETDDFAQSAKAAGLIYKKLLDKIIRLGRQWTPV